MTTFLQNDELLRRVPSIFAPQAKETLSSRYKFVSTADCLNAMQDNGFGTISACQSGCRDECNKPYVKHLLRLRHEDSKEIDGVYPEVVLVGSHNGKHAIQLRVGFFRIACLNGLISGDMLFGCRICHHGDATNTMANALKTVTEQVHRGIDVVSCWKSITMSEWDQETFAESAQSLKWREPVVVSTRDLLKPHRESDVAPTLWNIFNRLQENIIKGGIPFVSPITGVASRSRMVRSVNETVRLNAGLWNLAETFAA